MDTPRGVGYTQGLVITFNLKTGGGRWLNTQDPPGVRSGGR